MLDVKSKQGKTYSWFLPLTFAKIFLATKLQIYSDLSKPQMYYLCTGDQFSTGEHPASEAVHTASRPDGERDVSSLAAHLLSSRIRRAAGKISDICCEKGCSMKELIQFC